MVFADKCGLKYAYIVNIKRKIYNVSATCCHLKSGFWQRVFIGKNFREFDVLFAVKNGVGLVNKCYFSFDLGTTCSSVFLSCQWEWSSSCITDHLTPVSLMHYYNF